MTTFAIGGQSSGDFRETSARVQLLHVVTRNAVGVLTPDAFTQLNPPNVTTQVSTTLATITKVGVLGGTFAFTRPDYGNGFHGGPTKPAGAFSTGQKPLGIFLNDAIGNAFENTPGVASGRGPYVCGNGSTVGDSIYETKGQITQGAVTAGQAVTYAAGNVLYVSVNGLITNLIDDAYERNAPTYGGGSTANVTIVGIVKVAPDANSSLLVFDLRV
jgi:hypothetical protein